MGVAMLWANSRCSPLYRVTQRVGAADQVQLASGSVTGSSATSSIRTVRKSTPVA